MDERWERLLGRLDFDSFNFASLYIHLLIKSLEFYIEHVVDIRRVVWMRNTTDYLGDASHPNTLGFARQKPGLTLTSLLSRFFTRICLPLSLSGGAQPNPRIVNGEMRKFGSMVFLAGKFPVRKSCDFCADASDCG